MVTFPIEDLLSAAWLLLAVLCRNHQSTRQFCDVLIGCRDLRYTSIAFNRAVMKWHVLHDGALIFITRTQSVLAWARPSSKGSRHGVP